MSPDSTSKNVIPFNRPSLQGNELNYIAEAVEAKHISGDGQFTHRCHEFLETQLGVSKALLTTSCTHALEMSAMLLDLEPGDEVILPSFAFVSTANAFVLRGARPVFVDIRPDTLNLDERQLEKAITPRTKAIVLIHYGGVGCEMDVIGQIAARHEIAVVEDNAHGLLGKYKDQFLGTFGTFATLSFHETKNFTCGEGGALLLNNAQHAERAEIIREKGTNRANFFRGSVDKYTWVDLGSSYLPSDLNAAFLLAQFEAADSIQQKRKEIWNTYTKGLTAWAQENGVGLQTIPEYCEQAFHMFYMILPNETDRDTLIAHLKSQGVTAPFHYLPLHLSTMGARYGGAPGDCPVTEDFSGRLVRLPFYNALSSEEQERVITATTGFQCRD